MKKFLLLLAGLITIIVLLTVGLLAYATATDSGLQTLLAVGKKYAPGGFHWDKANGCLLGPLELRDLSYAQNHGLRLSLQTASFDWRPKELFSRQLQINHLRVDGLELYLPEPSPTEQKPAEPLTLPEIHLPLGIHLQDINLRTIRIYPYQVETPIAIDQLQLAASVEDDTLHIKRFKIASPEADAELSGNILPQGDYPLDLKLGWQYTHADFGRFSGSGSTDGDLAQLQIDHQINGAVQGGIKGELTDLISQPAWNTQVDITIENPGQFTPQLEHPVKPHFKSKGNLDNFNASGRLDFAHTLSDPLNFQFNAQGNTSKIKLQEALLKLRDHPANIKLYGDVDIKSQAIDMQGEWASLQWPLLGEESEFSSPKGQLTVKGSAKDFVATIQAGINGRQLVPLNLKLQASGKDKALTLSELSLRATKGNLKLNAKGDYNLEKERFQATGKRWPGRSAGKRRSKARPANLKRQAC